MATDGARQPVDSSGQPICITCPTRLSRCKGKLHGPWNKKQCQRCYNRKKRSASPSPSVVPPKKKQRRTKSEPGQPLTIATTRLRIRAPKPPPPAIKPRLVKPSIDTVDPMALLEAAHTRRLALLEEEKNGNGSSTPNASSVV